jgi:hypothetical protein
MDWILFVQVVVINMPVIKKIIDSTSDDNLTSFSTASVTGSTSFDIGKTSEIG